MAATAIRTIALLGLVLVTLGIVTGEMLLKGSAIQQIFNTSPRSSVSLRVVGSPQFDFGEQPQQAELAHTFHLRNESGARIRILEYRTSCSCMATPPRTGAKLLLAPGEQLEVPVTFKTGNRQSSASAVLVVSYCRLDEKDDAGNTNRLELRLTANITPPYRLSREVLDFGAVSDISHSHQTKTIDIVGLGKEPLRITDIKVSSPRTVAVLKSSNADTNRHLIDVTLNTVGLTASQQIRDSITITLNSESSPISYVQVKADYRQSIEAAPSSISVPSSISGTVKREFRISPICRAEVVELTSTDTETIRPGIVGSNSDGSFDCEVELADCAPRPVIGAIRVSLRLLPDKSSTLIREMSVPVYRFSKEREHEN